MATLLAGLAPKPDAVLKSVPFVGLVLLTEEREGRQWQRSMPWVKGKRVPHCAQARVLGLIGVLRAWALRGFLFFLLQKETREAKTCTQRDVCFCQVEREVPGDFAAASQLMS